MPLMSATPAPSPTIGNPGDLVSVVHGLWSGVTSSPIVTVSVVALAVVAGVRLIRQLRWGGTARDPVRRFNRAERAVIKRRAGERCEHHGWLFGRCRATQNLEADHVHPHSRGGQTLVANGQALCRRHNRLKSARVPFGWELRRLGKRRQAYFPPGELAAVTRRASR
jgi:5-methylcytosine-specific restriction endonuclease McrA